MRAFNPVRGERRRDREGDWNEDAKEEEWEEWEEEEEERGGARTDADGER